MYHSGEGVPENYVLSYKWANLAAARGNEKAKDVKNEVRKRMTREQIAEAQQLSLDWEQGRSAD
jgi:TPR repeat protein